MNKPRCFLTAQSVDIADTYFDSFVWVLDQQNRDGSWGTSKGKKAMLTPHGVQLLIEAGFPLDQPELRASVKWLKVHISHDENPIWYGRIPALAAAGEAEWLDQNKDIELFLSDLDKNRIKDFFWYVLPVMLSLKAIGKEAPYNEIADQLRKYERAFGDDHISVGNKPNHTGLAASYLHAVSSQTHEDRIRHMINWLKSDHRFENTGVAHWDNSIGVTAYVLMDFARMELLQEPEIKGMVESSLRFFKPLQDGMMPPDRFTSTFDTQLHESSTYTTLLALRAMATVFAQEKCVMRSLGMVGIGRFVNRDWRVGLRRFVRRYRRTLVVLAGLLVGFILAGGLLLIWDIRSFWINTGGAIFGVLFTVSIEKFVAWWWGGNKGE